jgi:hypothetical protein
MGHGLCLFPKQRSTFVLFTLVGVQCDDHDHDPRYEVLGTE